MKSRPFLMLLIATIGVGVTPLAAAAFKCATKAGVSYQDKPCQEETAQPNDVLVSSGKPAERARALQKQSQRTQTESDRAQDRPKSFVEQRKADEAAEHAEWLERAARKADSLKRCATGEVKCSAASLRVAALYLSENQLESALGAPAEKQLVGLAGTSHWKVRVNNDGGYQSVKIIAAWGLCSDEKAYFASGLGPRACMINVE